MRARRAVVLGRLGRGAVVVGQGDEAEDLSGGSRDGSSDSLTGLRERRRAGRGGAAIVPGPRWTPSRR